MVDGLKFKFTAEQVRERLLIAAANKEVEAVRLEKELADELSKNPDRELDGYRTNEPKKARQMAADLRLLREHVLPDEYLVEARELDVLGFDVW